MGLWVEMAPTLVGRDIDASAEAGERRAHSIQWVCGRWVSAALESERRSSLRKFFRREFSGSLLAHLDQTEHVHVFWTRSRV